MVHSVQREEGERARFRHRRGRSLGQRVSKRRLEPVADWLLVALVLVSVLWIGSVTLPAVLVCGALGLLGGAIALRSLRAVPRATLFCGALAGACLLQIVPLPLSWLSALSPAAAEVWSRGLHAFGEPPPAWAPLSIDPGATRVEALKWLTYALAFAIAEAARVRRGALWLLSVVFVAGSSVAAITLLHGALGLELLFGVYRPHMHVEPWNLGPLLNTNNLAGYCILALFCGLGLLSSSRAAVSAWVIGLGGAALVAALLLSGSRAAIGSAAVGGGLFFLYRKARRAGAFGGRRSTTHVPIPLVLSGLAGLVVALSFGGLRQLEALTTLDIERKSAVWRASLDTLADFPWWGVGRGAFETAFPPYQPQFQYDWTSLFAHAESFPLQWLVEWGVLVGGGALAVFVGWFLRAAWRLRRRSAEAAAVIGAFSFLLQNLADLALEVPGVCIALVVVLAACGTRREPAGDPAVVRVGCSAAFVSAGATLVASLALSPWAPVRQERRALGAEYASAESSTRESRREYLARVRAALQRHPGEGYFSLLGARVAAQEGLDPMPWLARALERSPNNGHVHLTLAEVLARRGATSQALMHLRFAVTYDATLTSEVGRRAAAWAPSVEAIRRAFPPGAVRPEVFLAVCGARRSVGFQVQCFEELLRRWPESERGELELARAFARGLGQKRSVCSSGRAASAEAATCAERLSAALARLEARTPGRWEVVMLRAQLLEARGQLPAAASAMANACPPDVHGEECAREALRLALAAGEGELVRRAGDAYVARNCRSESACAVAHEFVAEHLRRGGRPMGALRHMLQAAEREPSAARWVRVATLCRNLGLETKALAALARALRAPDADEELRTRVSALRRQLTNQAAESRDSRDDAPYSP